MYNFRSYPLEYCSCCEHRDCNDDCSIKKNCLNNACNFCSNDSCMDKCNCSGFDNCYNKNCCGFDNCIVPPIIRYELLDCNMRPICCGKSDEFGFVCFQDLACGKYYIKLLNSPYCACNTRIYPIFVNRDCICIFNFF